MDDNVARVDAIAFPQTIDRALMPADTFCSDTLYVSTDPGSLPSFAKECGFGNLSSDSYHEEKTIDWA